MPRASSRRGLPFDLRFTVGAFAILDASSGSLEVTIERVAYDADAVAEEVRAAGLPGELADKLLVAG